MKNPSAPAALLAWAALASIAFSGCVFYETEAGKVREGRGFVRLLGDREWKEAEDNSIIFERDLVATGDDMRMHLKIGLCGVFLDENSSLYVGTVDETGMRRIAIECGDVFFSVPKTAAHPLLIETAAGRISVRSGLVIARLVDKNLDEDSDALDSAPGAMEMNVVVVSGEAVVENCALGRRIKEGFLCYSETGAPPAEPVAVDPDALKDTKAWLSRQIQSSGDQFLGPAKPRKSVFVPKAPAADTPKEEGRKEGS